MINMDVAEKIIKIVGPKAVLTSEADKSYASLDKSSHVEPSLPLLVVKVNSTNELIEVARCCFEQKVPVVIRALGTGKSGGALGASQAVVIDISALNRIISIDRHDLVAEVEPGVILNTLKEQVKEAGLFYPPDPASFEWCSIGGNVAENASGPSTLKYGTTRDYLLGGQVLLATGELMDFGKRCPKGVTGYDLASLLCGSEGTLGIFTKLILRLLPLPKSFAAAECFFLDEEQALKAVTGLLNRGHRPTTLEYVDEHCLKALYQSLGLLVPSFKACLIIECDDSFFEGADLQLQEIIADLKDFGLKDTVFARDENSRKAMWQKRAMLSEACSSYLGEKISEDVAVPLGRLFEFCAQAKALNTENLTLAFFGHAGDGNLHVQIMFNDKKYVVKAEKLRHEILLLVLRLKGTLTAEHGIGLKKKSYLPLEQSASLIELQKRIKRAFDPDNLLNPGKIF